MKDRRFNISDAELARFLLPQGLTVADLEALAKEAGAGSLRDDKGRLDRRLLEAFLGLLGEFDTKIPTDFAGQLAFIKEKNKFRGGSQSDLLKDVFGLAVSSSPFLRDAFAGFDPTTVEGRAAILKALPAIIENQGAIGKEGLGDISFGQFKDLLNLLFDLLSGIDKDQPGAGEAAPSTPVTGDPTDPLPVEPVPDPVFPPELLKQNWEELLGIETSILEEIRARFPNPGILPAPELPVAAFGNTLTGPGPNAVSIQITGPINISVGGTGNPAEDGQAAGAAFLQRIQDELLGTRFLDVRDAQGNNSRFFR